MLFKSHQGYFYLFFCSASCDFFFNTCFLGFFTFFLPLLPTFLPPYLIPSQGLSTHPSICTFASRRIIVFSPRMSTVSGISEFLRYVRCSGLHITPYCYQGGSHTSVCLRLGFGLLNDFLFAIPIGSPTASVGRPLSPREAKGIGPNHRQAPTLAT